MNPRIAVYAGSFDPPTNGHLDIVSRASRLFDRLYVVVGENIGKNHMFSVGERLSMMVSLCSDFDNVEVVSWNGLIVDFAKSVGAGVLVRGVRSATDSDRELELARINRMVQPGIDVVLLPSSPELSLVSSSAVRELAAFGADISGMVPAMVEKAVSAKSRQLT